MTSVCCYDLVSLRHCRARLVFWFYLDETALSSLHCQCLRILTLVQQDEADDVAAFSGIVAEKESAARSAAEYAARKQREVDDARAAELPASVSISDMENGACLIGDRVLRFIPLAVHAAVGHQDRARAARATSRITCHGRL